MATLWYGSMDPMEIAEGQLDHLLPEAGIDPADVDDDALAQMLRAVIRRIVSAGEARFLPLPVTVNGVPGRMNILVAPGIPIAVFSECTPQEVDREFVESIYEISGEDDADGGVAA